MACGIYDGVCFVACSLKVHATIDCSTSKQTSNKAFPSKLDFPCLALDICALCDVAQILGLIPLYFNASLQKIKSQPD